jgi:5-methylcytosine-specific restriction endonuclease McrA
MSGTDLGTTARQRLTASRKLLIWERNRGICCLCGQQIDGVREEWFIEHKRALELGGTNDDENLGPAHRVCKPDKDADDHRRAAKAKRVKQRFLGIRRERWRALPGSRSSSIRMTIAHGPVDRRTGRPLRDRKR